MQGFLISFYTFYFFLLLILLFFDIITWYMIKYGIISPESCLSLPVCTRSLFEPGLKSYVSATINSISPFLFLCISFKSALPNA